MNDGLERAKKLFFDYAGNRYSMYKDGVLEEYEKFAISPTQESDWRKEYISHWENHLSVDQSNAISRLIAIGADEVLPDLITRAHDGDSFSQFWIADATFELALGHYVSEAMREQGIKTAVDIWRSFVEQPIKLTDQHKAEISLEMKEALKAATPEEYVSNYARIKLADASRRTEASRQFRENLQRSQWMKRIIAETLPIHALDKEKQKWLEQQHQLARTWFGYKFKPRSQEPRPDYVNRVLADIQRGRYLCYFRWEENIRIVDDQWDGASLIETGPGVEIIMLGGPWEGVYALDKETVLQWAREEGVIYSEYH